MSRDSSNTVAPSPAWLAQRECGNLFWLRVMRALSLWLGRRLSRPILYGIALYFLLAVGKARRASRTYLSRTLGRAPGLLDIYRHFLTFASTVHDRVFLLNDRFASFKIEVVGIEQLESAIQAQGGVFLFGAHLGSFEAIRAVARQHGRQDLRICLAMYEENARRINGILAAINPANAPEVIPLGKLDSMLTVHHRLGEGALVGILADRSLATDDCVSLTFMGHPAQLPVGPFRMAAMLKRPIVFMTGLYRRSGHYEIHFEQIADFTRISPKNREAAIMQAIENYAIALESYCHKAPLNWFNFYDFWKAPDHAQN